MRAPNRENLQHLESNYFGELDAVNFKREWSEKSKLAKHILAIANSGGGCIFVGTDRVNDEYRPVELKKLLDPADVAKSLSKYAPRLLEVFTQEFFFPEKEYPNLEDKKSR